MNCNYNCCHLHMFPYTDKINHKYVRKKKAGVMIYYKCKESKNNLYHNNDKILLVQSNGNLWGIPKGTFEDYDNNNPMKCAIREVQEETGIVLKPHQLSKAFIVHKDCFYYFVRIRRLPTINILDQLPKQDVTGITWIKIRCLKELIRQKKIKLNYHTILCLYKFIRLSI